MYKVTVNGKTFIFHDKKVASDFLEDMLVIWNNGYMEELL